VERAAREAEKVKFIILLCVSFMVIRICCNKSYKKWHVIMQKFISLIRKKTNFITETSGNDVNL